MAQLYARQAKYLGTSITNLMLWTIYSVAGAVWGRGLTTLMWLHASLNPVMIPR